MKYIIQVNDNSTIRLQLKLKHLKKQNNFKQNAVLNKYKGKTDLYKLYGIIDTTKHAMQRVVIAVGGGVSGI